MTDNADTAKTGVRSHADGLNPAVRCDGSRPAVDAAQNGVQPGAVTIDDLLDHIRDLPEYQLGEQQVQQADQESAPAAIDRQARFARLRGERP